MSQRAYLILEDGTEFEGSMFGAPVESLGEVVFNTSMSGYQEVLTDPSYDGQIIAMTYPMIGNYGVNDEDVESDRIQVAGFVVKEYAKTYSSYRATKSLGEYLADAGVAAIEGIDTRKLTRHIRDKGAMRAGIFFDRKGAIDRLMAHPKMDGLDLTWKVACREPHAWGVIDPAKPLVAVYDFGVKTEHPAPPGSLGFSVMVYPGNTPLAEVLKTPAKGIFLSNGPGDPDAVTVRQGTWCGAS